MYDFYDDDHDDEKTEDLGAYANGMTSKERNPALSEQNTENGEEEYSEEKEYAEEEPPPNYDEYGVSAAETDSDADYGMDERNADYDIEHPDEAQDREILAAEEEELHDPLKNDAFFIDRNKIILIITAVAFVSVILFLCMPQKRKSKKNDELDKAGKVYIPSEIDRWYAENAGGEKSPDEDDTVPDRKDAEKFTIPGINDDEHGERRAPVEVPQRLSQNSGSGNPSVPVTNRNEQQKAFFNIPLEKTSGADFLSNASTRYPQNASTGYAAQMGASTYTPAALTSNLAAYLSQQGASSSYDRQNNQSGKQSFLDKERGKTGTYQWNSEFSLWKGTVIPAVLDSGINTDLPGQVIATVTQNIYSSNNGNYILIPQGSKLFADYNSSVSYGQNRVQVVWNTLIRPDGLEINLGSMNGIDQYGYAGYKGSVSNHPFEFAKALGLIAVFSILDTKMANTIDTANNQYAQNVMASTYAEAQKLNNKIVDRALDIQPRISIAAGEEISLITNLTMELPPLDSYPVEEKYIREY